MPSPYCPCRLAVECPDGIRSSSEDSSFASATCESPNMIRCCASSGDDDASVNNTLLYISEITSRNDTLSQDDNTIEETKGFSSVIRELSPDIIPPPENFVYPEYSVANEEINLNNTETSNLEKIGMDILGDVRHTMTLMEDLPMVAANIVSDTDFPRLDDAATPEFIATNSMEYFPEGIIPPPIGFVYPEYVSSDGSFLHVPAKNSEYVQPEADDGTDPYIPRRAIYPDGNEKFSYDRRLIDEAINFESKKIQPRDQFAEYFLSNSAESCRSPRTSSQLIKRNVSNRPDLDESVNRLNVNVQSNAPGTLEAGSFDTEESKLYSGINDSFDETIADNARPNADIDNNRDAAIKSPSELGESVIPTRARTTDRYVKQSMIPSSPKDVPTTTIINSVERKTSSETFLPLDRISIQPINKNTPTTNKFEVTRNNGGSMFIATRRRNSLFSSNAKKIKQFARYRGAGRMPDKPRGNALDRRVSSRVEDTLTERRTAISASVPARRNNPLQAPARDDRSTMFTTLSPATSQKDTLNEKDGKAEYKNSTVQKEGAKSSLGVDRSELGTREGRKGSAGKDAKNVVEPTTVIVPARRIRLPPRVLSTRPTQPLKKERNPTDMKNIQNAKRRFSDYFRHFYERRDDFRLKINNKVPTETIKSTVSPFVSKDPNRFLSAKKNGTIKEESVPRNLLLKKHVSSTETTNTSSFGNLAVSERSSSGSHKPLTLNLRNANPISEEIATHLNASVFSQEIGESTQMETDRANHIGSSTVKNAEIARSRKVAENLEQSLKSDTNKGINVTKYVYSF